jgi:hypothetical protein
MEVFCGFWEKILEGDERKEKGMSKKERNHGFVKL